MLFLAEISDKVPTVAEMWFYALLAAALLAGLTFSWRYAFCITIPLAMLLASCFASPVDDDIREIAIQELSRGYFVHGALSATFPLLATACAVMGRRRMIAWLKQRGALT